MSACSMCKKVATDSDSVTCDICRGSVHSTCAGLSKAEVDCLRSKRRRINYYCDKCDIISTINDLKKNILDLKTEMEELKNTKNVNDPESNKKLTMSEGEMIAEFEDRQARVNNLILYNLPESDKKDSSERQNDDKKRCGDILLGNLENRNIQIVSCIRLGKFNAERNRLVRITVENQQQALNVLKAYKSKDGLYLNRDLTAYQRNISYKIRKEFKERKNNGEDDIMLKYRHGIPMIVKPKNT